MRRSETDILIEICDCKEPKNARNASPQETNMVEEMTCDRHAAILDDEELSFPDLGSKLVNLCIVYEQFLTGVNIGGIEDSYHRMARTLHGRCANRKLQEYLILNIRPNIASSSYPLPLSIFLIIEEVTGVIDKFHSTERFPNNVSQMLYTVHMDLLTKFIGPCRELRHSYLERPLPSDSCDTLRDHRSDNTRDP